jgi:hypothetical protein
MRLNHGETLANFAKSNFCERWQGSTATCEIPLQLGDVPRRCRSAAHQRVFQSIWPIAARRWMSMFGTGERTGDAGLVPAVFQPLVPPKV